MQIPDLFSSMSDAYQETCRFLQARPQMPWNRRRIWAEAEGERFGAIEVSVPSVGSLSLPARTSLFDMKGWGATEAALRRHPVASRHFGDGFSLWGRTQRLQWQNVRLLLLNEIFFRTLSLEFDESAFTSLYEEFEEFLFADTLSMRVLAPLQGVECSDTLALRPGVIQRLATRDASKFEPPQPADLTSKWSRLAVWSLAIELTFPKKLLPERTAPEWSLDAQAKDLVESFIVVANRAHGAEVVFCPCIGFHFSNWVPLGGSGYTTYPPKEPSVAPPLALNEQIARDLEVAWQREHESRVGSRGRPSEPTDLPRMPASVIEYVAVFRAHAAANESVSCTSTRTTVALEPGPVTVSMAAPQVRSVGSSTSAVMAMQRITFGPEHGPYIVFKTKFEVSGRDARSDAQLVIAETRALVELRYPGLIRDLIYEGVNDGQTFFPDGSMTITASRPQEARAIVDAAAADLMSLAALGAEERNRFRLAARWYSRGLNAVSLVDKILYYWIALEVHPSGGSTDVVGKVTNYLKTGLQLTIEPRILRERLCLSGKHGLCRLRGDIVHEGLSSIADEHRDIASHHLDCLEAIVKTCLRLLAGLPPGDDLARYLEDW